MGIGNLSNEQYERLRTGIRGKKVLNNIHNFDIFQNPEYAENFQYQVMERRTEHESSDRIASLIYMGEQITLKS